MDQFDKAFGIEPEKEEGGVSTKRKAPDQGDREYLRVYETMPAQLLNAYGMAAYMTMDPEKVWGEMNKPLKTGAKYMTELCSAEAERRGVGINRFLQCLVEYCKYQKTEGMQKQNKFIIKEEIYSQLYKEIEAVHGYATYCLASKKAYAKKGGGSSLRSSVSFAKPEEKKSMTELNDQAKQLYKWMTLKTSRLRMIMLWQAGGGLPYVAGTHLYGMRCFIDFGNACHSKNEKTISLEEFQEAVCKRHEMEAQGHEYLKENEDFK
jgi:hypothetical protein